MDPTFFAVPGDSERGTALAAHGGGLNGRYYSTRRWCQDHPPPPPVTAHLCIFSLFAVCAHFSRYPFKKLTGTTITKLISLHCSHSSKSQRDIHDSPV